jgi:hypothetical protein
MEDINTVSAMYKHAIDNGTTIPCSLISRDLNNAVHVLSYLKSIASDEQEEVIDKALTSLFDAYEMFMDAVKQEYEKVRCEEVTIPQ